MLGMLQFCCQFRRPLHVGGGGQVVMYIRRLRSALIHFVPIFYPQCARQAAVLLSVQSWDLWMSVGGGGWAGYDVYSQVSSHPFCAIFYPPYARHAAVLLVQETSGCVCVCVCGGGGGYNVYQEAQVSSSILYLTFYPQYARHAAVLLLVHFVCLVGVGVNMYYIGRLRSALIHFVPIFYPPYAC